MTKAVSAVSAEEISIGGIRIRPFQSMDEAVNYICANGNVRCGAAIAINPEKVMTAQHDAELRELIDNSMLRFADGIGVIKSMQRKGVKSERIPGCELWMAVMAKSAELKLPVMLIGARPEVNEKVVARLKGEGVNVVHACHGYAIDEAELIAVLQQKQPKIVSVAMGSPKQEKLIARLQAAYPDAFYQGVGGSFDVYAGAVKRAPKWACDLHAEWLYRLCREPKRIFRQRNLVKYLYADLRGKL